MGAHSRRWWNPDYRTLLCAIGLVISMCVLILVLDEGRARQQSAATIASQQRALNAALDQSRANSRQLDKVIALDKHQQGQLDTLHRQLVLLGVKPADAAKSPSNTTTGSAHTSGGAAAPAKASKPSGGTKPSSGGTGSGSGGTPAPVPVTPPKPAPAPAPAPSKTGVCVLFICIG